MSTETELMAAGGKPQQLGDETLAADAGDALATGDALTAGGPGAADEHARVSGETGANPLQSALADDPSTATLPLDPSLGETPDMPLSLVDQVIDFLVMGGPVVWILCAFSVVALTIVLLKLWQFAVMRAESAREIDRALSLWSVGDRQGAIKTLRQHRPVTGLVGLAMKGVEAGQESTLLREELSRVATQRLGQMRSFLRPLEVIATLSPLLGLLGTVLGMIVAFKQMEAAGSQVDPSVLSGGIWQALLTTAVGLAVAIPVMTIHNWLERKVERVAVLMNDSVTRVFTSALSKQHAAAEPEVFRHAA
ncbi:MotA/TolQ/ExbB proton channel family protein [Marinobacterium sp. YM272]|uniref:MotA/TolQ/ExbB proton channel family protein n=1 Tax=Marinobacterium sp. YM272 TaxID=3421654 RepID=UPI003D7F97EA